MRKPKYTFADIVGMSATKQRLLTAAREIVAGGRDARNGMMLFGDPGNGKTLFAEALAGELRVPFISIAYGDVASKWINETPQKIRAAFAAARHSGTGVFFIDEIDSFLKNRGDGNDGSARHSGDRDMTNVMLTEIVNLRGTKIVLIAATNLRDQMDAAGIREGRFDFQIEVPPPDMEARQAILRKGVVEALGHAVVDEAEKGEVLPDQTQTRRVGLFLRAREGQKGHSGLCDQLALGSSFIEIATSRKAAPPTYTVMASSLSVGHGKISSQTARPSDRGSSAKHSTKPPTAAAQADSASAKRASSRGHDSLFMMTAPCRN
jgi:ATPase family associated with various cellular activities (AAA)